MVLLDPPRGGKWGSEKHVGLKEFKKLFAIFAHDKQHDF